MVTNITPADFEQSGIPRVILPGELKFLYNGVSIEMHWASAISTAADPRKAVEELASAINVGLEGRVPHLLVLFISAAHHRSYATVLELLDQQFPDGLQIGCTASGVIGDAREIEQGPAISITAGHLPNVHLKPIYLDLEDLPDSDAAPHVWRERLGYEEPAQQPPHFLLLADPFTPNMDRLLEGLDYVFPDSQKFGGLASGSGDAKGNRLILDRHIFDQGAVLLSMTGEIGLDVIVAQGCRPIGPPATITACHQNTIIEINDKPALEWLSAAMGVASEADQRRAKTHLFIGLSLDPFNPEPQHGEFLIRNLVGVDYETGSIVVGGALQEGQLVRFHLRDGEASHDDLDMLLTSYKGPQHNIGLLLFSCLGRGEYLYRTSNHDSDLIREHLGPVPVTGCFCNGEIGPVGDATHIHGYTSVLGVLRPPS